MLITALLTASLLTAPPADTSVLVKGRAFLWFRRPTVQVVVRSNEEIGLLITAREPQFFSTTTLTLHLDGSTETPAVAELRSDSSFVDARSNVNRHTLVFHLTPAQLSAWSAGRAPLMRVGKLTVKLNAAGRYELANVARGTSLAVR